MTRCRPTTAAMATGTHLVTLSGLFLTIIHGQVSDEGVLMFLQAGSQYNFAHFWEGEDGNAGRDDPYYHHLPPEAMINGGDFRSDLIDQWGSLGVTMIDVGLFNAEGMLMKQFFFENVTSFTVLHSPVNLNNADVDYRSNQEPSLYVHKTGDAPLFSFMSLHTAISNAQSQTTGEQFIISANDDFSSLPLPGPMGCFNQTLTILSTFSQREVTTVLECAYFCLTVSQCEYVALYAIDQNKASCLAMTSMSLSIYSNTCDYTCEDGYVCGNIYHSLDAFVTVSTYSIAATKTAISSISAIQTTQIKILSNNIFDTMITRYKNMNAVQFVAGVHVEVLGGTAASYTLAFSMDDCLEMEDFQSADLWLYHGFNMGHITHFLAGTTYNLEPVWANCVAFTFNDTVEVDVYFTYVTGNFLFAEYLVVYAEWDNNGTNTTSPITNTTSPITNETCVYREVMSDTDVIPYTSIYIQQKRTAQIYPKPEDVIYVPAASLGTLHINLRPADVQEEVWLDTLEIKTTNDAYFDIDVISSNVTCTDQINGNVETVGFEKHLKMKFIAANTMRIVNFTDLTEDQGLLCVGEVHLHIMMDPLVNSSENVGYNLKLFGCAIIAGQFIIDECTTPFTNIMERSGKMTVLERWIPLLDGYAELRPGGAGLGFADMYMSPYIEVLLSSNGVMVAVEQVTVTGNILMVYVQVGDYGEYGHPVSGAITVHMQGVKGISVTITDISRAPGSNRLFTFVNLEIIACVSNISNTTSTTNLTATSSTALLTTSTPGISTTSTPGISTTSTPGISTTSTPGISTTSTPGISTTSTPGISTTPTPGISTTSTSGISTTSTPGISTTSTPGISTTSTFSPMPSTTMPSIPTTTIPAITTPANPNTSIPAITTPGNPTTQIPAITTPANSSTTIPAITTPANPATTISAITMSANPATTIPAITTPANPTTTSPATTTPANPATTIFATTTPANPATTTSGNPITQIPAVTTSTIATSSPSTHLPGQTTTNPPVTTTAATTSPSNCTTVISKPCCLCGNKTVNITVDELEEIVEDIVKNLTVDVTETQAYKRSKTSAPDDRTSSKVVGTVGIAIIVTTGLMVVVMDIDHILNGINLLKTLWQNRNAVSG